jgi:hypothetical protein
MSDEFDIEDIHTFVVEFWTYCLDPANYVAIFDCDDSDSDSTSSFDWVTDVPHTKQHKD